ncbi:MAG: phosphate ABC transporter ATP-binding protein [Myxococcota bacterium]
MALESIDRPKIRVQDLSFFYGKNRALKDNALEIAEKRVNALIGPSGCGKSTHIRTYNRMFSLYPGQRAVGRVWLDDIDVLDPSSMDGFELRSRVGMVLQRPTPFPMSIWDNVAFGPKLAGLSRPAIERRVVQALQQAGLWEDVKNRLNAPAGALTTVQQQMMCIARALAVEPEVLLLDEPCGYLDPGAGDRIEELVLSMRDHVTVVLVTHNVQQAARVSDYTAVIFSGEIVEHAPTDVLFTRPSERRTEDYITGKFG